MKAPYIIAEIANAHDGELEKARALVSAAKLSGADGVKFQIIIADELLAPQSSQRGVFEKLQFSRAQWVELFALARSLKLDIWTDVYGLDSLTLTDEAGGVHGYKIHTSDILNEPLMREVGSRGKPVLLSCSGSPDDELKNAITALRSKDKSCRIILMHGFQAYPTPPEETRLVELARLRAVFGLPIGIQDHNDADHPVAGVAPILAAALGAEIVEKHLTLDRAAKGIDYYSSLNPDEFGRMVQALRALPALMGVEAREKVFSETEKKYAKVAKKKLVALKSLKKGQALAASDIGFKRTDDALADVSHSQAEGRKLKRDVAAYEPITRADLE